MFKILPYKHRTSYSQSGQRNPLEWQVVAPRVGAWQAQTNRFLCREFFNDMVAKKHGRRYTCYGMNNSPIRHREDGVTVALFNIIDMEVFLTNVELIDDKLFADTGARLSLVLDQEDLHTLIIGFPPQCFENTYIISLLTLALRVANSIREIPSWEVLCREWMGEDIWSWTPRTGNRAAYWGFRLPENLKQFWWYRDVYTNSIHHPKHHKHAIHSSG